MRRTRPWRSRCASRRACTSPRAARLLPPPCLDAEGRPPALALALAPMLSRARCISDCRGFGGLLAMAEELGSLSYQCRPAAAAAPRNVFKTHK